MSKEIKDILVERQDKKERVHETLDQLEMYTYLDVDTDKIQQIVALKLDLFHNKITVKEGRKKALEQFDLITGDEFAVAEQYMVQYGISDDEVEERIDEILTMFDGLIHSKRELVKKGHSIRAYQDEALAIEAVLKKMMDQLEAPFNLPSWEEIYKQLHLINIHLVRKQNQLYSALEEKGFDKPSKIMWSLDNKIRDSIKEGKILLNAGKVDAFISFQNQVHGLVQGMLLKEWEILFPIALELIEEEAFVQMREGDDEIGYSLIDVPPALPRDIKKSVKEEGHGELIDELTALLAKFKGEESIDEHSDLQVSQGKMTLKQINMIYRHLQVELSYIDEHDRVRFYSDSKERIFPRSQGAIGRHVNNCHPKESLDKVQEIIRAFRAGEQSKAEFWLELGERFIYIIYVAVRDEAGIYRGVLEMMQDVTRIRSLEGSQRLVSWQEEKSTPSPQIEKNMYDITPETSLGDILKEHPFIKTFLPTISPKFEKLKNPILFKMMVGVATMEMIAQRGDLDVNYLIDQLVDEIDRQKNK